MGSSMMTQGESCLTVRCVCVCNSLCYNINIHNNYMCMCHKYMLQLNQVLHYVRVETHGCVLHACTVSCIRDFAANVMLLALHIGEQPPHAVTIPRPLLTA